MLLFSLLLYLVTSYFICAWVFQYFSPGKFLVSFFITVFSINVLIFEILALLHRFNDPRLFLALQILICSTLIALIVSRRRLSIQEIFQGGKNHFSSLDYVLIVCLILILGGFFTVGITTAPNNLDSLNHHLLKIYFWLQHGSLESWPASWYPQLYYPVNAHFQGTWLFLLGRSEKLFFLVQWFSLVLITTLIYEIARTLKFTQTQALTSALVGLSFPVVLLQTYSFQGDLIVTSLGLICIYLLFLYFENKNLRELLGAILALALALGTKQTAFFILPVIGVFGLYWVIRGRILREHVPYLLLFVAFFLIFSAFKFIQNQSETGSFLGNVKVEGSIIAESNIAKIKYSIPRDIYEFISFDGLPKRLQQDLNQEIIPIFRFLDDRLGLGLEEPKYLYVGSSEDEVFRYDRTLELSEDTAWFGPLGFILLPLALGFSLTSKDYQVRKYAVFVLILCISYGILVILQRPGWNPYEGRYFILGLAACLPLVSILIPSRKGWKELVVGLLTFCVMVLAFNTLLFNSSKPIITYQNLQRFSIKQVAQLSENNSFQGIIKRGVNSLIYRLMDNSIQGEGIYDSSRIQQVYYSNKSTLTDMKYLLDFIPEHATINLLNPGFALEYGLFGENMTRKLFPLSNLGEYDGRSYLVVPNNMDRSAFIGLLLVGANQNFSIYKGNAP
jgi:4-amino-4-deoxy-L-arabinose transferase-like glycosyltransferase